MEIWAHTMVKNESRWLWYSVTSVVEAVDKILLWDTGSTDGSIVIEKELARKYPEKIILVNREQKSLEDFTKIRQEMLDATKADWFLMLDGDEMWWKESISKVISSINSITKDETESVVVPTVNLAGDIFHFQDKSSGMYKFGNLKGHYNLRAVKRSIPGLHSQGIHGVWGWADINNKMIQDRDTFKFIDAPYLHATNIIRSNKDMDVAKRSKKIKYELGINFSKDYYYPESLFKDKPDFIQSPWVVASNRFKFQGLIETPLRKMKRKIWTGKVGY